MAKKYFLILKLVSNEQTVILDPYNIAFAIRIEGENEKGQKEMFTRIFLKQITINDESNWIDVQETPEEIIKKIK